MSMGNVPFNWIECNLNSAMTSPSTTHCKNNILVDYLSRYLIQRVMSVFKFTLPESVDERYFKYVLFCNGWIVLTDTVEFGSIAYYASLSEMDLYYRPKKAIITFTDTDSPVSQIERTLIGENPDAVLMTLQENYNGILDMVYFYAERIALLFEAFDVNVWNSKLAYVMGTDQKSVAETFKKAYDNLSAGSPMVVVGKDLFSEDGKPLWDTFFNNLRANYIGSDLMIDIQKCLRDFDTQIGLPNANTDKRERLTTDEVNSNNAEVITRVEMWIDNMNSCFERMSKISKNWSGCGVELRVPDTIYYNEEVISNGQLETNPDRNV